MNVQTIELELSKERALAQVVRIGQGDSDGTTIAATVYDGGVSAQLSGMSARFCMRLPDGTHYVRDSDCSVSGSQITYVVDEEHCASVHGKTEDAYFELVDGETVYSTSRFTVIVLRSAEDADTSPAESWDNNFDEWLEGKDAEVAQIETRLIDSVNSAVSDAQEAMQQAVSDTNEVIDRAEDAIDAIGDISELAVPLMSPDTRGGAKLEEHGGLALRDGALGIGSLVQESDGYARGGLAEVTANGHAEQVATTGKNLIGVSGTATNTTNAITFTWNGNHLVASGTATSNNSDSNTMTLADSVTLVANVTYIFSFDGTFDVSNGVCAMILYNNGTGVGAVTESTDGTWTLTPTNDMTFNRLKLRCSTNGMSINVDARLQLELGSAPTTYEPYTGGLPSPSPDYPQEIQVVRGRNLWDEEWELGSINDTTGQKFPVTDNICSKNYISILPNTSYCCSRVGSGGVYNFYFYDENKAFISRSDKASFVTPANAKYALFRTYSAYGVVYKHDIQLTLGSTPQPYVPYWHVGMEARDPDTDELISCTALPLPSRGWVAGLPDGTADSLRLDGAGKCEWELKNGETTYDGGSEESWGYLSDTALFRTVRTGEGVFLADAVGSPTTKDGYRGYSALCSSFTLNRENTHPRNMANGQFRLADLGYSTTSYIIFKHTAVETVADFTAYLAQNPVTVLYPLSTPVTEDCGYVDMPAIPSDCTISIPELDAIGIKYFVDDTVTQYGREIYARVRSEYADRITALEQAVAELATS